jgi:hypothetical protein
MDTPLIKSRPSDGLASCAERTNEPDENRGMKETKCFASGTSGEKSERSIVPTRQGNQPEGPCGGKGSAGQWNRWRDR